MSEMLKTLGDGSVWMPGAGGYVKNGKVVSATPQYSNQYFSNDSAPAQTTGYEYKPFDYSSALKEIPGYQGMSESEIQAQADTAAQLLAAPQTAAANLQEQRSALDEYNNMRKLQSSQAGVDQTLAWNASQGQKADALAAAQAGASVRSGLVPYLASQRTAQNEGDKLALAAQMASQQEALGATAAQNSQATGDRFAAIAAQQGLAASDYYNQMFNNQNTNLNNYNMNRNQVGASLGTIYNQGQDIAQRNAQANMTNATTLKGQNEDYALGLLPYTKMTKADEANAYNQSSNIYGKAPGSMYIGGRSR